MLLRSDEALPVHPRRILVAGTSSSGKTTLAGQIGLALGLPHTEIDGLYHGPDWAPRDAFVDDVDTLSRHDRWVTEWQYGAVRNMLADRADLVLCRCERLDPPPDGLTVRACTNTIII